MTITRFAPSPTGYIHVGNLRTALMNYLIARKNGGEFILRIDDTDPVRSKEEYVDGLKEDLTWLGLHWDRVERQSERLDKYHAAADELRKIGRFYEAWETPTELDLKRKKQLNMGKPPVYDRAALNLSEAEKAKLRDERGPGVWRFKLDQERIEWKDGILGDISIDAASVSDPVLIRGDGQILYTLASVVDDTEMGVTNVVRGSDHVTNTATQIQIMQALGGTVPTFAHHSLLTGPQGEALSKRLGVLALRARGHNEYDGGENDFVQQVAGIYGELPVTTTWRSRLTLSEARDELDTMDNFGGSVIDTRTQTARWQNNIQLGAHEVIAGAEISEDRVSSTNEFEVTSRDNTAVFTQALLDFSPFAIQASLRYDDNEAYGDEVTGSLALGYELDNYHTLRASIGTAFKAPSFNDLYWPNSGNPDLNPEKSETVEVGVRGQYSYSQWFWDVAVFQNDYDDLIAWAPTPSGLWAPQNVNNARIRGAELSSGVEVNDWVLQAAYTYLDPEDQETGNRLARRASQSVRLDADRELGDWSLGGSLVAQVYRYDNASNTQRLGGYGLVNLRAGWQFAPLWTARVTVENAFDKEYETSRDYINAGRAGFLSVHFGQ